MSRKAGLLPVNKVGETHVMTGYRVSGQLLGTATWNMNACGQEGIEADCAWGHHCSASLSLLFLSVQGAARTDPFVPEEPQVVCCLPGRDGVSLTLVLLLLN